MVSYSFLETEDVAEVLVRGQVRYLLSRRRERLYHNIHNTQYHYIYYDMLFYMTSECMIPRYMCEDRYATRLAAGGSARSRAGR